MALEPSVENLTLARPLFGTVLDRPGGLTIGTTHTFYTWMFSRFRLEADVSPLLQIEDAPAAAQRLLSSSNYRDADQ